MLLEQIDLSQDVDILDGLLNDGSEAIEKFRTIMNSLWMTGRCSLNEYNLAAHNLHRVSCILGVHLHRYGYSVQVGGRILVWMIVCRGAGVQSSQNSMPSFTRIKLKQNSYHIYECSLCCYVIQSMMPTMPVPTTTNVRCINTRYLLQDLRAVQSMALADILVNGIFSTPITFGLEDKEANDEGLASVVENAFSTSNAPQISDADADSSKSGKENDENEEDNNNKDEEKEIRDTTTAPAVKNDDAASNSGHNSELEIKATTIRMKCEGASGLDVDKVGYIRIRSYFESLATKTLSLISHGLSYIPHTSERNRYLEFRRCQAGSMRK